ncbi:MAG: 30S ribosomal protein S16 [Bacteriovoracaceae bacterium]|nr:30S ribosomal protein S16 [Bacteriovoracaceae bacterium]
MVKIRLARGGRVHKPIYTIVATDSRNARDGRFLEKLGKYDPAQQEVLSSVNTDRIAVLVSKGAVLSATVSSLLKKNNIELK